MNYREILEHSCAVERSSAEWPPQSRLEYLGDSIFEFTTYDGDMAAEFARKAVEVCAAISGSQTFDYIEDPDNYRWYLLMCNMPFFADRIEWGGSVRGAWWDFQVELNSCGLWDDDDQLTSIKFSHDEWFNFIAAVIEFSRNEN